MTAPIFSRIVGTGHYLPERVMSNAEISTLVDTSDEWITERTGIKQRHLAADHEFTSDLAAAAVRRALADAHLSETDVDLIIVATSTPDMVFPSTACIVQHKLGAKKAAAFDVQAVCSGFVYALATADAFIKSGQHRNVLVIGAEVFSRILDWTDRNTCVLFGDGAGAVVLQASDKPGVLASKLRSDGSYSHILNTPAQLNRGAITGSPFLHMDGQAVFKLAVRVLEDVATETLEACGCTLADVDWLIVHQANQRIIQFTAKKLGLPMERVVLTVDQHANTSAASIPLALDVARRDGRIKAGHKLLLEGVGGGFTWGACFVQI
jgi:3-oxoacyl-[acyl-carrier-protein] synthase III